MRYKSDSAKVEGVDSDAVGSASEEESEEVKSHGLGFKRPGEDLRLGCSKVGRAPSGA